jgi:hypothetical protein
VRRRASMITSRAGRVGSGRVRGVRMWRSMVALLSEEGSRSGSWIRPLRQTHRRTTDEFPPAA